MILVDLSQIMISNIMVNYSMLNNGEFDQNMCRHMILNSLRAYNCNFRGKFGQMVLAVDSDICWRKDFTPMYKANRVGDKQKSHIDWDRVHSITAKIKTEAKLYLPFIFVKVEGAEGDDIIAVLTERHYKKEPILVISGDKDFRQLQRYKGVEIYHPIHKHFVNEDYPLRYLKQQIIRGDKADNVPNILSPMDTFMTEGARQRPISTKKIDTWMELAPEKFCHTIEMLERYNENRMLIDFTKIPEKLQDKIMLEYRVKELSNIGLDKEKIKKGLTNYFNKYELNQLKSKIEDFYGIA